MASGCVPTRRRRRATGGQVGQKVGATPILGGLSRCGGRSHLLPCPPDQPTRPREISFMYQDDTMALMAKELKIERETLPLRLPKELAAKIGLYARFTAFSRDYVVTRILEYVGRIVEPRERSSPCVPRRWWKPALGAMWALRRQPSGSEDRFACPGPRQFLLRHNQNCGELRLAGQTCAFQRLPEPACEPGPESSSSSTEFRTCSENGTNHELEAREFQTCDGSERAPRRGNTMMVNAFLIEY